MKRCSIEGCEKPAEKHRRMCSMHRARVQRHGDATKARRWAKPESAICIMDGCDNPHMARGWCMTHYYRWRRHGDPRANLTNANDTRPLSYNGAHGVVKRERGRAVEHRCAHCDAQASTWAYDHADPHELVQGHGSNAGMSYSLDVWRYLPLCRLCHERFDAQHRTRESSNSA